MCLCVKGRQGETSVLLSGIVSKEIVLLSNDFTLITPAGNRRDMSLGLKMKKKKKARSCE